MKRPIIWAAFFVSFGILARFYFKTDMVLISSFFIAVGVCAAAVYKYYNWTPAVVFIIFCLIAYLRTDQSLYSPAKDFVNIEKTVRMTGFVVETDETSTNRQRLVADIWLLNDGNTYLQTRLNVLAVLPQGVSLNIGQTVVLNGELLSLDTARNPGGFDEFMYYRARKIAYKSFPTVSDVGDKQSITLNSLLAQTRRRLANVYNSVLSPNEAAIMRSIIIGDRAALDENTIDLYRTAGIFHLLCISGLHVSIISLAIYKLLSAFLNRRIAGLLTLFALVAYCLFTGSSISTVRATLMAAVIIIGRILFRDRDTLSSVGFVGVCLLIYEPLYLFDAGFQLSFSAVLGIATLTEPIDRLLLRINKASTPIRTVQGFRSLIAANLAAVLGTLPAVNFHFYTINIYVVFINIIIVPTAVLLVGIGVLAGAVGLIWIDGAIFLAGTLSSLIKFYKLVSSCFVKLPLIEILTGRNPIFTVSLVLLLCAFAYWQSAKPKDLAKRKSIMLAAVIPLFISLLLRYLPSGFTITMLDVGQGDSFVIQNGYDTFIIDGGGLPNRDYGKNTGAQVVAPYLDYLGISEVAVFVTHPDNDHIAGILELFPKKNIRQVYLSKTIDRSDPLYLQLMGLCEESNARVDYLSKGGIVESGTVRFNVIYPMDAIQTKGNESSLVIQVKQQKFSVLFTGDISADIENALSFDSPSILKLAHHGSKYSNSHEFVKAVNPPFALVSAGRNNMYNHPSAEVLEFFYNSGIPIYNTQTSGAVILKINKNIRVREMIKTEGTKKRY